MIAKNCTGIVYLGLAAMAVVGAASAAQAADSPLVVVNKLLLDKVTTVNGTTTHTIVDPSVTHDKVVPGSHMVVVAEYTNTSKSPIEHIDYKNPLPAALMLSDDGFGDFDVSVDGGKTFGKLATLVVTDATGAKRPAQASDVTAVRWLIPQIAPGASGKLEYHAVVR